VIFESPSSSFVAPAKAGPGKPHAARLGRRRFLTGKYRARRRRAAERSWGRSSIARRRRRDGDPRRGVGGRPPRPERHRRARDRLASQQGRFLDDARVIPILGRAAWPAFEDKSRGAARDLVVAQLRRLDGRARCRSASARASSPQSTTERECTGGSRIMHLTGSSGLSFPSPLAGEGGTIASDGRVRGCRHRIDRRSE